MKRLLAGLIAIAALLVAAPRIAAGPPGSATVADVHRSSVILLEGDSLNDGSLPYQQVRLVVAASRLAYANPDTSSAGWNGTGRTSTSTSMAYPTWVNHAVNGSQFSTINARLVTELTENAYDVVVVCTGTNQRTIADATSRADFVTMMDAITGTPSVRQAVVVGPYAWGEKVPSGANDGDTGHAWDAVLDLVDLDEQTIVNGGTIASTTYPGYPKVVYVSLRQTMYAVALPAKYVALGTPLPGVFSGPWTGPDASGAHFNGDGVAVVKGYVLPVFRFVSP